MADLNLLQIFTNISGTESDGHKQFLTLYRGRLELYNEASIKISAKKNVVKFFVQKVF